jgi:hypothetical protein
LMLTPAIMSVSLLCCTAAGDWSGRVLPDGRSHASTGFNNIAYIDASHLEAYSSDLWANHGIAGLARTLMRQGYLPLLVRDLSADRLERAGLLISIGPAREFSIRERDTIKDFVAKGGTFICLAGAEEAPPSAPLLADFNFAISPSPVPPREGIREPEPLGAFRQLFGKGSGKRSVQFYAGWPVTSTAPNAQNQIVWFNEQDERPIVVSQSEQGGRVVVIGDTHLASNQNLETNESSIPDNIRFWRWLLSRVVPGHKAWEPPAASGKPAEKNAAADEDNSDDADDGSMKEK